MTKRFCLYPLAFAACVAVSLSVRAGDRDACNSSDDEVMIPGCTRVIDAGKESVKIIAKAHYNRGNAFARRGAYESAIADYDKAISFDPKDASAYLMRGKAYYKKSLIRVNADYDKAQHAQAIKDFNRALLINPKEFDAFFNRGNVYVLIGDYERAIADFGKYIARKPSDFTGYFRRGFAHEMLGNKRKAVADYRKVLSLQPGHQRATDGLQRLGE